MSNLCILHPTGHLQSLLHRRQGLSYLNNFHGLCFKMRIDIQDSDHLKAIIPCNKISVTFTKLLTGPGATCQGHSKSAETCFTAFLVRIKPHHPSATLTTARHNERA